MQAQINDFLFLKDGKTIRSVDTKEVYSPYAANVLSHDLNVPDFGIEEDDAFIIQVEGVVTENEMLWGKNTNQEIIGVLWIDPQGRRWMADIEDVERFV